MDAMLKLVVGGQRMGGRDAQSTQFMMSGRVGGTGDDPEPTTLRNKERRDERTEVRPKLPILGDSGDEHTVLRPHVGPRMTSSPALAAVPAAPLPPPPVAIMPSAPVAARAVSTVAPAPVAAPIVPVAAPSRAPAKRGTLAWGAAGFAAVALAALAGLFVARGTASNAATSMAANHAAAAATVPSPEEAQTPAASAVDPLVTPASEPVVQSTPRALPVMYHAPARLPVTPAVAPVVGAPSAPTPPAATAPATQPVAEATTPEPAASFTPPPTASTPEGNDAKKLNEEADKELINLLERTR
jgi:hypothetical protein